MHQHRCAELVASHSKRPELPAAVTSEANQQMKSHRRKRFPPLLLVGQKSRVQKLFFFFFFTNCIQFFLDGREQAKGGRAAWTPLTSMKEKGSFSCMRLSMPRHTSWRRAWSWQILEMFFLITEPLMFQWVWLQPCSLLMNWLTLAPISSVSTAKLCSQSSMHFWDGHGEEGEAETADRNVKREAPPGKHDAPMPSPPLEGRCPSAAAAPHLVLPLLLLLLLQLLFRQAVLSFRPAQMLVQLALVHRRVATDAATTYTQFVGANHRSMLTELGQGSEWIPG